MEMEPVSAESLLPMEVWGKIFQHSAAEDAWNFRLVCSAWRMELDEHYDKWTVRVDQTSPYFQSLLQLKVKQATIVDLYTPVDFGQEEIPRFFEHPDLLEKLSIPTESPICLQNNMMPLLKSCRKTIKHLQLTVGDLDDDNIFDPAHHVYASGLEFTNLESLTQLFCTCPTLLIQELTLFKVMIGLSTMSKIKSLRVFLSYGLHNNALFSTFLAFVGKNGTNLEEIQCHFAKDFSTSEDEDDEDSSTSEDDEVPAQAQFPANSVNLDLLRQVRRVQTIHIECDGIGFNDNFKIEFPFNTLLETQRNLTNLHLRGIHISGRSLTRVCYNNEKTLTTIKLYGLDCNIDLEILAGCVHLKNLFLEVGDSLGFRVLQNSRSLPIGIQTFESYSYYIESKDILKLFTGHEELVNITLHHSGSDGSNGVTAAVFAVLTINRNLSSKLKDVDIGGFNCSTEGDVAALNEIVRGLNYKTECVIQDFQDVRIQIRRAIDKDGDWSGWNPKSSQSAWRRLPPDAHFR